MSNQFYTEVIAELKNSPSSKQFLKTKVILSKKYGLKCIPSTIDILLHASPAEIKQLNLITKPVRTLSGVVPVAIMTKPHNCPHGRCTFCPGGINSFFGTVPQSYTGHEPATMRGMRNNYDAYLQVINRLEQYVILGQSMDKVDIIIMGGTFLFTDKVYKESFVRDTFRAMNVFSELFFNNEELDILKFKEFFELPGPVGDKERSDRIHKKLLALKGTSSLEEEKQKNEFARIRCIGLTIETKPDFGMLEHGNEMLSYSCTRVELGIQTVYDDVLKITNRGHTVADSIKSLQTLKDLGFKINAHWMPGLPLTNKERDIAGFKELFSNHCFRPDMLKIYPCMVSKGTLLYQDYLNKKFTPLSTEEAAELIANLKKFVPEYCRIQRIQRDVPTKFWDAGVGITNLRQYIHEKFKPQCRCIRCREPQGRIVDWTAVKIISNEYYASKGSEMFISAEDTKNDIILGFCRLRKPSQCLRSEITPQTAIIRELHVYGTAVGIGEESKEKVQHKGLGKQLIAKAERIAKENLNANKMLVISGVGVREYYRKLGYKNDGPYVSKVLK